MGIGHCALPLSGVQMKGTKTMTFMVHTPHRVAGKVESVNATSVTLNGMVKEDALLMKVWAWLQPMVNITIIPLITHFALLRTLI